MIRSRSSFRYGDSAYQARRTHLLGELLRHDVFGVKNIEVGEVDENLSHALVENDGI